MEHLRHFLSFGAVLGILAACNGSDDPTTTGAATGGLALTVATDGTITPDRLSVRVTGGATVFLDADVAIGASSTLPYTANIDARGTANLVVKAWQGATPLDRRDVVVGPLPASAYAPVMITLGAKCSAHVRAEGQDIVSDCATGTTCNPADGSCGGATDAGPPTTPCTPGAPGCDDGGSPQPCTLGSFRCGAGREVQQCQADGSYKRFADCDYACADGKCVGECAPTSSRCCILYSDGTKDCVGPSKPVYVACIAGNCQSEPPAPTGVVVERCGSNAMWGTGDNCLTNCTAGSDLTTVGCGYCAPSGAARCLDKSCTCE